MSGIVNTSGEITNLTQNAFFAYRSTTNQTGLSNGSTIICDTVLLNQGSGYNGTTGIFTAPVTGNFLFTAYVVFITLSGVTNAATDLIVAGNTYRLYGCRQGSSGVSAGCNGGIIVPMTSGQTAKLQVSFNAGTGSVIGDSSNQRNTFFSCMRVGG